jgi:hypothetical protein
MVSKNKALERKKALTGFVSWSKNLQKLLHGNFASKNFVQNFMQSEALQTEGGKAKLCKLWSCKNKVFAPQALQTEGGKAYKAL